jgi:hypothetical protein
MESGGNAVHDGTRVTFSATLGRVEPADVETRGGMATTTFVAGSASGTAQVRAISGAATGSGGTGENQTAGNVVEIVIGGAATTVVTVSASPSRVGPSGGTVTILATALDAAGNRLVGVPISFSTDVGRLSASSALSDGAGEARVTLTTDRQAVVTARAGGQNASVTVTVGTAGSVTLTPPSANPIAGVAFTLTVVAPTGTTPRVQVNWGDGTSDDLGIVSGERRVAHTYRSAGSYTITATATADGESFATSVGVTVNPPAPIGVSLAATGTPAKCSPMTFTATVTGADASNPIIEYRWRVASTAAADEFSTTTTGNTLTRVFREAGTKSVSVTAVAADGRTGSGQTEIVIPASTTTCS